MMKKTFLFTVMLFTLTGCVGFQEGMTRTWDDKPKVVIQYSGGQKIGQWTSRGKVHSETDSDGYYFIDNATGKFTLVSGDVQISNVD